MSIACEECDGSLVAVPQGVLVCSRCGLVQEILPDRAVASLVLSKQRLGSVISKKTASFIDCTERDISSPNQLKFNRLKKLQDSIYGGSCLDVFQLHRDLEHVARYLMLPDDVIELSMNCFDGVISKVRNPYNSYALLMAVCLVSASRTAGERAPVKLTEIVDAFEREGHHLSVKVLAKTLCYASNIIPLNKKFRQSEDYVGKVIDKLKNSPCIIVRIRAVHLSTDFYFAELSAISKELLSQIPPPKRSGKNPFLLAASAVYEGSSTISKRYMFPQLFTKVQFSKDVGIAEYTLRSHLASVFAQKKTIMVVPL
jgi:transcription initiation factor TFIIIB Brf1 subunit/transcription initiation factor TFIIB